MAMAWTKLSPRSIECIDEFADSTEGCCMKHISILQLLSVFTWRIAYLFFEDPGEVIYILITKLVGNFLNV